MILRLVIAFELLREMSINIPPEWAGRGIVLALKDISIRCV
jgi:hypothetical protein